MNCHSLLSAPALWGAGSFLGIAACSPLSGFVVGQCVNTKDNRHYLFRAQHVPGRPSRMRTSPTVAPSSSDTVVIPSAG